MEPYFHSSTHVHGMCLIKRSDNSTFTIHVTTISYKRFEVSEQTLISIFRIDESASSTVMTRPCASQNRTGLIKEVSCRGT